jgi:hypothetical protein
MSHYTGLYVFPVPLESENLKVKPLYYGRCIRRDLSCGDPDRDGEDCSGNGSDEGIAFNNKQYFYSL